MQSPTQYPAHTVVRKNRAGQQAPKSLTGIDFTMAYDTLIRAYARIHCSPTRTLREPIRKGQGR